MSNLTCRDGLILPALSVTTGHAVLYLIGLFYCFLGISIAADVFMCSIERITSTTRSEFSILNRFDFFWKESIHTYLLWILNGIDVMSFVKNAVTCCDKEVFYSCMSLQNHWNAYLFRIGAKTIQGHAKVQNAANFLMRRNMNSRAIDGSDVFF